MEKEEFLKKLEIEMKISKFSPYTLRNYLNFNQQFLDFTKKNPSEIAQHDIKNFLADKMTEKAPSSIILFLASIKFSFS